MCLLWGRPGTIQRQGIRHTASRMLRQTLLWENNIEKEHTVMIIINLLNADKTLVEAASELSKELGFRFEEAGIPVSVKKIKEGLTLEKNENGITIGY